MIIYVCNIYTKCIHIFICVNKRIHMDIYRYVYVYIYISYVHIYIYVDT